VFCLEGPAKSNPLLASALALGMPLLLPKPGVFILEDV